MILGRDWEKCSPSVYTLVVEPTDFDGRLDTGYGFWPEQLEEWSCHLLRCGSFRISRFLGGSNEFSFEHVKLAVQVEILSGHLGIHESAVQGRGLGWR